MSDNKGFSSISELVKAIYNAGKNNVIDERLAQHKAPTGINATTNADGGYLVTEPIVGPLLANLQQKSKLYSKTVKLSTNSYGGKIPFISETTKKSNDSGMLNAYWVGEGSQKSSDNPSFGLVSAKLHKLVVLMPATDEIMQDPVLLNDFIDNFVAAKIGWEIDKAILMGNGATSMYGIMSADSNGTISVAQADPLDEATLNAFNDALAPVFQETAEFYMSQENYIELQAINFTNENDKYYKDGSLYIYGKKVNVLEQMETPYDLMLGDASQYVTVTKGDIQKSINISLRYDYDESVIRWLVRINGKSFGSTYDLEDGSTVGTFVVPNGTPAVESSSSSSNSSEDYTSVSSGSSPSSNSSSSSSSSSLSSPSSNSSSSTSSSESSSSSQSSGLLGPCEEIYTGSGFANSALNGIWTARSTRYNNKATYENGVNKLWYSSSDIFVISATIGSIPATWLATADDDTRACPNGAYNGGVGTIA